MRVNEFMSSNPWMLLGWVVLAMAIVSFSAIVTNRVCNAVASGWSKFMHWKRHHDSMNRPPHDGEYWTNGIEAIQITRVFGPNAEEGVAAQQVTPRGMVSWTWDHDEWESARRRYRLYPASIE